MLHYGYPCWIDDILDALHPQVQRVKGLTADRVYVSLADDEAHASAAPADLFAVIRPQVFPVNQAQVVGGGRLATPFDGTIRVALFARLGSDQEFRDSRAMRERSRSITRKLLHLLGALQLFAPTTKDADGVEWCLLTEPMRLLAAEFEPRRLKAGAQAWAVAATTWQVKFRTDLTTAPE